MDKNSWEEGGFFSFRTMITPGIIKLIYVLGAIGITIAGVVTIISAIKAGRYWGGAVWGVIWGIGIIILGNLLWRVFCEELIVLFKIHDLLSSIEKRFQSLNLPDTSAIEETLGSIAEELKGGTSRLISIEEALKEGFQQLQRAQTPPLAISETKERPSEQARLGAQQFPPPQTEGTPPKVERPRTRRHLKRWVLLLFLIALGVFIALPIASGYTRPQGLTPQAISKFLAGLWDYWVQIVRGLK